MTLHSCCCLTLQPTQHIHGRWAPIACAATRAARHQLLFSTACHARTRHQPLASAAVHACLPASTSCSPLAQVNIFRDATLLMVDFIKQIRAQVGRC